MVKYLDVRTIGNGSDVPYDGMKCIAAGVEVIICLPDAWKLAADDKHVHCDLDYEDWPPSATEQK